MPTLGRTDAAQNGNDAHGQSRWKPAFLSREGRNKSEPKGQDEQWKTIDNFLHKSSRSQEGNGLRYHEPEDVETDSTTFFAPSCEEQDRINHPEPRPARIQGLSVTFNEEAPEVIGEGGDEASSPSIAISNQRHLRNTASGSPPTPKHGRQSKQRFFAPHKLGRTSDRALRPSTSDAGYDTPKKSSEERSPEDLRPYRAGATPNNTTGAENFKTRSRTDDHEQSEHPSDLQARDVTVGHNTKLQLQSSRNSQYQPSYDIIHTTKAGSEGSPKKTAKVSMDGSMNPPFRASLEGQSGNLDVNLSEPSKQDLINSTCSDSYVKTSAVRLFKGVVQSLGSEASTEFSSRMEHVYQLFRLGVAAIDQIQAHSSEDWIRAAVWWFLRGRKELEQAVRAKPHGVSATADTTDWDMTVELRQGYVDLAKSWWIVTEVTPQHQEYSQARAVNPTSVTAVVQSFGSAAIVEYLELHSKLLSSMRGLAISMKRNERLPPPSLEATHLDLSIWTNTSDDFSDIEKTFNIAGLTSSPEYDRDILKYIHNPLSDTDQYFNFGSMFVDLHIRHGSSTDIVDDHLHCILTVIRKKDSYDMQARVSAQTGRFTFIITENDTCGPSWNVFQWHTRKRVLSLPAAQGGVVELQFFEKDFKNLWSIRHHSVKVQKSMQPREHERQLCTFHLGSFRHASNLPDIAFPTEPLSGCTVRLFERWQDGGEALCMRKIYSGVRLHVLTPPSVKIMNHLELWLEQATPILFNYMRGEADAPALLLRIRDQRQDSKLVLAFATTEDRSTFHAHLDGSSMADDESCSETIPLEVAQVRARPSSSNSTSAAPMNYVASLPWQRLRVINRVIKGLKSSISRADMPQSLRIWAECPLGSLVDRINVGPGELCLSLGVEDQKELRLSWPEQGDATASFSNNMLDKHQIDALRQCLRKPDEQEATVPPKLRAYKFQHLEDLHRFQYSITSFTPIFDGIATSFSISRRRMVVPMYKKLESTRTRLQVLVRGKTTQLLAFFQDLSLGACVCFVLKSTDKFESFSRSEQFFIRMVDAKFALPKSSEEANHDFVSLDMPEYATEHDDILIGFGLEEGQYRA